jgi:hypothetical protein
MGIVVVRCHALGYRNHFYNETLSSAFNFESVQSFTYLSSLMNANNDNCAEIQERILWANKCFYGLRRQFRSQFLSIKNKIIYIRP